MSDGTKIEWTHVPGFMPATWNPVAGCTRVSEGCRHCYAETMAGRFSDPGQWGHGLAERTSKGGRWTGRVELLPHKLDIPLRARTPRCYFVNSTSDLFHEGLCDTVLHTVFSAMALSPRHRFIVLTKRAARLRDYFSSPPRLYIPAAKWPLRNVWLGVSVEDRDALNRMDELRATPAAVRLVSIEPLLQDLGALDLSGIDWVIAGGESGPHARPMHPHWARSIRDQCIAARVPFFFKQWGTWAMDDRQEHPRGEYVPADPTTPPSTCGDVAVMAPIGKKRAGRLLDGVEWSQFPSASA